MDPPLDFLQVVNVFLGLRNTKPDSVLHRTSHRCQVERDDPFLQPAGCALANTASQRRSGFGRFRHSTLIDRFWETWANIEVGLAFAKQGCSSSSPDVPPTWAGVQVCAAPRWAAVTGTHLQHRLQPQHTRAQRVYPHGPALTLPRVWALQADCCFIPGATAYPEWINPTGGKNESSQQQHCTNETALTQPAESCLARPRVQEEALAFVHTHLSRHNQSPRPWTACVQCRGKKS